MKTFKDLVFKTHKASKKGIQATLEIKPKLFLSVIAGPGWYSSPGGVGADESKFRDNPDSNDFSTFEVGIIDENLPDDQQEWDVKGWMSRGDINNLILENHG